MCFRGVIDEAAAVLRNAAGNYYVNDKSTGSIVAQQPFGGARASGKRLFPLSEVTETGKKWFVFLMFIYLNIYICICVCACVCMRA